MSPLRTAIVAASLAVAVVALGGCDSGSSDGGSAKGAGTSAGPSVIAPGKPGEAAETLSAADAAKKNGSDDAPNSADFAYAQMMIKHHKQALEMTVLAPTRAASSKVKRLASRIASGQAPEISAMKGWLKTNGGSEEPQEQGHDHAAMPGMATEAQLKELRAAKGKAFDELFLKLMITHHDGAVTMATDVLAQGNNIQIEEMANDVIAQQTSEINRMRELS
ncbi:DUF305 domain-containing protein [Streptomyces sp. NPDC002896]|uniref:DUF305 domain-containing protein n=1 Tax=Streptomyces sp. NPDC002896 TaxID=3154438 RepID=UPI0033326D40